MSTLPGDLAPWIANRLKSSYRMGPWVQQALCTEVDPDLFFPDRGQSGAQAKVICRTCPVQTQCFEWALNAPFQIEGIWGGTSEVERREFRKRRGIPVRVEDDDIGEKCGSEAGAKRHYRAGEKPCPSCARAASAAWQERKRKAKERKQGQAS